MGKVLIADDNRAVQSALELMLSLHDLQTVCASSPADAIACIDREPIDLVIQDMNFAADTTSGDEGVALFRELRVRDPDLPIILLTAWTPSSWSSPAPRTTCRSRGTTTSSRPASRTCSRCARRAPRTGARR
jgi:DNA-binding NtrC family response regulator